ncbi:hypothetical protein [Candidatus Burkholderia verschuerenii]|uniref:hypothetical protein n=1 Tax=Candidatus Burkholderia verschuerenii TaxID=242163 RepID=UPI00067A76B0|nr:hypothetical protein [Candidatus Burkholderia verschuerenii]
MKTNRKHKVANALIIGATMLGVVASAHADSAARKLGQVGLINQTLQPKPPKSSLGYEPNTNSTYNANDAANANTRNAVNAGNPAAAAPPAGAYPLKPNTR